MNPSEKGAKPTTENAEEVHVFIVLLRVVDDLLQCDGVGRGWTEEISVWLVCAHNIKYYR